MAEDEVPQEVLDLANSGSQKVHELFTIITRVLMTADPDRTKYSNDDIIEALQRALKICEIVRREELT